MTAAGQRGRFLGCEPVAAATCSAWPPLSHTGLGHHLVFTPAVFPSAQKSGLSARGTVALSCDVGRTRDPRRCPMRTGRPKATKLIPFYALKEDLLPVLEALESNGSVKYV